MEKQYVPVNQVSYSQVSVKKMNCGVGKGGTGSGGVPRPVVMGVGRGTRRFSGVKSELTGERRCQVRRKSIPSRQSRFQGPEMRKSLLLFKRQKVE